MSKSNAIAEAGTPLHPFETDSPDIHSQRFLTPFKPHKRQSNAAITWFSNQTPYLHTYKLFAYERVTVLTDTTSSLTLLHAPQTT